MRSSLITIMGAACCILTATFTHAEMSYNSFDYTATRIKNTDWIGEKILQATDNVRAAKIDSPLANLGQFAFIPFSKTEPSTSGTVLVGSLMKLNGDVFQKISGNPFLTDVACKPPIQVDNTEDKVLTFRDGGKKGLSVNIGIANLNLSREEAISVEVTKIASIRAEDKLDTTKIRAAKDELRDNPEYGNYYVVESQDLYQVSYRKYSKKIVGTGATYSILVLSGERFNETDHAAKGYIINIGIIPLRDYYTGQ